MKKIVSLLASFMVLMILITGCGNNKINPENSIGESTENKTSHKQDLSKSEDEIFPLTVVDANGNEITLDEEPTNIVSLTLATDEILPSLVNLDRIAGVTTFAADESVSNVVDIVKDIPKVTAEPESIINMQPDIVFVASWTKPEFIQQLRDAGIPVYAYNTPIGIDTAKEVIMEVATVVGEKEKGEEIISNMDKKLKDVDDKIKTLNEEDKLTVMSYNTFNTTNGKGTPFDDIVSRAGLRNVPSELGMEGYPQISKEKIIELNTDIMILPSWIYDKDMTADGFAKQIKEDESFKDLKFIINNRIVMIPEKHMSSVSQYIVEGVVDTAKEAYPDLFK